MLGDYLTSAIRTGVPGAVAWLVAFLASKGLDVPAGARDWAVSGLMFAVLLGYYLTARALEGKFPIAGLLLGVPTKPTYSKPGAISVGQVHVSVSAAPTPVAYAPAAVPPAVPLSISGSGGGAVAAPAVFPPSAMPPAVTPPTA